MKQFTIKIIVFVLIICVILFALDCFYTKYSNTHKNLCQKPDWILNHKQQKFDFAFLGNSRAYNVIDVCLIEKKLNKTGINISMTGANFSEMYLILDQFIKLGNEITNLVLQVDLMTFDSKKVGFELHSPNYLNLFNDTTVLEVYKHNVPKYKFMMWKYLPFVRYMEYSNKFVLYKMLKGGFECNANPMLDTTKGSEFLFVEKFGKAFPKQYWIIDSTDVKYFRKITQFAKRKNINLILYTAPFYQQYYSNQLNNKGVKEYISKQSSAYEIPYFDFNKNNFYLCTSKEYFFDETHLNYKGSRELSSFLADSIKPYLK